VSTATSDESGGSTGIALELQGGRKIEIGEKQTDEAATQLLASQIAKFLGIAIRQ
jgi:hypothetical protein